MKADSALRLGLLASMSGDPTVSQYATYASLFDDADTASLIPFMTPYFTGSDVSSVQSKDPLHAFWTTSLLRNYIKDGKKKKNHDLEDRAAGRFIRKNNDNLSAEVMTETIKNRLGSRWNEDNDDSDDDYDDDRGSGRGLTDAVMLSYLAGQLLHPASSVKSNSLTNIGGIIGPTPSNMDDLAKLLRMNYEVTVRPATKKSVSA